ncbi:hypothetical protein [Streptomyces sp. SID13726]|uniref:hypothetical protein n=1 Tax=Streptomyces sp. SID13726 TaxID=2706058 RepID=UPI0013B63834|nr:hypothetical protein [Streptomyces sp. SID13726]NEB04274.1 hypothetical protein [Streptomyces sp. SID13726]
MLRLFDRAVVSASVGAACLLFLTACGGVGGNDDADKSGDGGEVASLNSPSAGGGSADASASADPDAGRPQIRLDSTQDDVNRMWDGWTACLKDHGVDKTYKQNPNAPGVKACDGKLPLDPPELDPAKNPDFNDDTRAMVRCMNEHGIKSVVTDRGWGLEDGASLNAPDYDRIMVGCQVKAFGEDD